MQTLQRHGEYQVTLFNAPLAAAEVETMARLLGHKGEPWLTDIRRRYAGRGPDFCMVAWLGDQPVSHLWVGPDAGYPRFAVLGHGVVCLPTYLVGEDLRAGRLLRILPKELSLEASAFAIYPQSRNPSPKVRALVDYLAEELGPEPEWDGFETAPRSRRSRGPGRLRA